MLQVVVLRRKLVEHCYKVVFLIILKLLQLGFKLFGSYFDKVTFMLCLQLFILKCHVRCSHVLNLSLSQHQLLTDVAAVK